MKTMRVPLSDFTPIDVRVRFETPDEVNLLDQIVTTLAPLDSTPASLSQVQLDQAFKYLVALRNAVQSEIGQVHSVEIRR